MQCPVCNVTLAITHRNDIEIDYCPQCRGVWLDRGELDKIIERASQSFESAPRNEWVENVPQAAPPPVAPPPVQPQYPAQPQYQQPQYQQPQYQDHRYDRDDYKHGHHGHGYKHRKKKNFLEDLFDFD